MRAFRVGAGAVLAVVGLVVFVAGAVTAFWIVGPDDVLSLRPHSFRGDIVAVTTRPDLLDYYGSRVVVTVEPAAKDRAVFVGVGHDIDVRSYLDKVRQTRLSKVAYPSSVSSTDVRGTQTRVLPPAALDWWVAKVSGTGRQTLSWKLADGPYDLVIMRADGDAGLDLEATLGLEVKGAFGSSLLVLAAGAVLLAGGVLLTGWVRRRPRVDSDDGELDWEGRELWEQNEYWTSSEHPSRIGGVLVPGDAAPPRSPDDQPGRLVSTQGGEVPPWHINGVRSGPGGPGEPMRSGGQREYASDVGPAWGPGTAAAMPPERRTGHPPVPAAGPFPGPATAGPSSGRPPSRRPAMPGPKVGPPMHRAAPTWPPREPSSPAPQGGPAPDSRGFTAPDPADPFRRAQDPTRSADPPARLPWRPAGGPAAPRRAAGPHGSRRVDPHPLPRSEEPDLSDFPSLEPDHAERPPWLPGPVGQPLALPSEQRDPNADV